MPKYKYGKSLISTNLKLEIDANNQYYKKIRDHFKIELILYCNSKKMNRIKITNDYYNFNIYNAIKDTFKTKIENKYTFHKNCRYEIRFKAFELKDITRYKYEKTDIKIFGQRRKYLLRETINVIAT